MSSIIGKGKRTEELFAEWTIEGEQWDQLEETLEIKYPDHIEIVDNKSIKELLGLNVVAPTDDKGKGKGKPDPKKGAAPVEIIEELDKDELGRSLPKILLRDDYLSYYLGPTFPGFRRSLSEEQIERKKYQDQLKANSEIVVEENTENPDEAINENIDHKQLYADALAERDVYAESPIGPEIDHLVCDAFRLVSRFATQQQLQGSEQEFLWQSIYPKLPNGRPCYNPAGKYIVKLFLAGHWRRIVVNDVYPVDSNGTPVIVSSLNILELWPTILTKAIYTIYKACSYDKSMPSLFFRKNSSHVALNVDLELQEQSESLNVCPILASNFLGLCLHCLTGWQPSTPWSFNSTLNGDLNHFKNLIQQFMFGGAPLLEQDDKPGEIAATPAVEEKKEGLIPTKLRTKSQLKEEYRKKLEERNSVVDKINTRQSKIDKITTLLAIPYSEVFTICIPDKNSVRIVPVLGVCYPIGGKNNSDVDVRDIELMVEWTIIQTSNEIGISDSNEIGTDSKDANPLTPYLGGLDQPLPPFTKLSYEWISVRELALKQAYVFGFDTLIRLPHKSVMGWPWCPLVPAAAVDDKKGKDKKAAPASSEPAVGASLCDQGDPPPVLLSLDSASFFNVNNDSTEVEGEEIRPSYIAKQSHLSISVFLLADNLEIENKEEGEYSLPSDVVLILQELRDDDVEPIVIRVELGQKHSIPLTSQTFHIPAQKISPQMPLVFWVRLFTKSSVMVYFSCSIPVNFGKAETIYKDLGYNAIVQEGESSLSRPEAEQLLFRYPLSLQASDSYTTEKVYAFLNIADREIASFVSMLVYSDEDSYSLPKTQGNLIPVSNDPNKNQMLIARLFQKKTEGDVAIPCPSFKWKLVILSKKPLIEAVALPVTPEQSFKGCYFPNNKLIICRDVINIDKTTFPVALNFTILPNENSDIYDTRLIVRIYRVSDRKIVSEYRARTMIQLYNLNLADFIDGEEEAVGAAPAAAKGKGKAPTGPEGVSILMEVSIDEELMGIPNHWKSRLPFNFDNKISSELDLSKEETSKSPRYQYPASPFQWRLNFLAGSVISSQHDIYDLERYAASKNAWEEVSEGRGDKSIAGVTFAIDKKKHKSSIESLEIQDSTTAEPRVPVVEENSVTLLVAALAVDATIARSRETVILNASEYKEFMHGMNALTMTENDYENEKIKCEDIKTVHDEMSQNGATALVSYNTTLKETIKNRIGFVFEDSTNNATTMASLWKLREDNKALLEKKNASLKWLLDKTKEALEKQQDAEDEASGKKPTKGGKKK